MLLSLARVFPKVADFRILQIRFKSLFLPTLLLPMDVVGDSPAGGGEKVVNFNFYDLEKKRRVTMADQRIPESIHLSRSVGSSRGWLIRMNNEDLTVHVTNMLNPSAPKSSHKVISLPPLLPLPYSLDPSESTPLTELVRNVALSSSPDEQDCVLAVKFWGSCISFCRLHGHWTHFDYLASDFKLSFVIYSNASSTFYLTPSDDTFPNPEIHRRIPSDFLGHGFPLVSYFQPFEPPEKSLGGKRFLVETPSGDIFIIRPYMETGKKHLSFCNKESDVYVVETKRFELYKRDLSKGAESYVGDIGDLCIFFGKNEPFCIPTTMYSGLEPNAIYFTEKNQICVYDIATHTIRQLTQEEHLLTPFWLPPISRM